LEEFMRESVTKFPRPQLSLRPPGGAREEPGSSSPDFRLSELESRTTHEGTGISAPPACPSKLGSSSSWISFLARFRHRWKRIAFCLQELPGCRTSRAIDIRTIDRHPLASVGLLVLALRCSWCPGSAPMPVITGLYAVPRNPHFPRVSGWVPGFKPGNGGIKIHHFAFPSMLIPKNQRNSTRSNQ
jgi:hypothetical protein